MLGVSWLMIPICLLPIFIGKIVFLLTPLQPMIEISKYKIPSPAERIHDWTEMSIFYIGLSTLPLAVFCMELAINPQSREPSCNLSPQFIGLIILSIIGFLPISLWLASSLTTSLIATNTVHQSRQEQFYKDLDSFQHLLYNQPYSDRCRDFVVGWIIRCGEDLPLRAVVDIIRYYCLKSMKEVMSCKNLQPSECTYHNPHNHNRFFLNTRPQFLMTTRTISRSNQQQNLLHPQCPACTSKISKLDLVFVHPDCNHLYHWGCFISTQIDARCCELCEGRDIILGLKDILRVEEGHNDILTQN